MYYKIITAEPRYSDGKVLYATNAPSSEQWIKEPKLTMESNTAGSLEFTISAKKWKNFTLNFMTSKLYVVRVRNGVEEVIWSGRLLDEERDSYNNRSLTYEGALAYFNDTIQPKFRCSNVDVSNFEGKQDVVVDGTICYWPFSATSDSSGHSVFDIASSVFAGGQSSQSTQMDNVYLARIITYHNDVLDDNDRSRQIEIGDISYCRKIQNELIQEVDSQDELYHVYELNGESTFDTITNQLLNKYGGEMRIRYEIINDEVVKYLDYIDAYASDRVPVDQNMKFGSNIVDISRSAAGADFATTIIPYGRSLSDAEKSWTLYENISGNASQIHEISTDAIGMAKAVSTGTYIDKDGKNTTISDSKYAVLPNVTVAPGEIYFVTQTIPSLSSVEDGMLAYAMFRADADWSWILVQTGPSIKSNKDSDTGTVEDVTYNVVDYEITIPEGVNRIKFAMYDPENTVFRVKKYNPHYQEDYLTFFNYHGVQPTADSPYQKIAHDFQYPEWNIPAFPYYTDDYGKQVEFMIYKKVFHSQLLEEFGTIEKVVEFGNADTLDNIWYWATRTLDRMTTYIKTEIEAVDLAWIDDSVTPYNLLDYARIISKPHNIGVTEVFALPIRKIELNFQDVASSRVWASNEVETRDGEPTYMSAYMSKVYKG